MSNEEFAKSLMACGAGNSVHSVINIIDRSYTPAEFIEFYEAFNNIALRKLTASLKANKMALERATYINTYLQGKMFTDEASYEKYKPCQIENSQEIIDRMKSVLNEKEV